MPYIIRRDPFREMMSFRSAMDRWFDDAFFRAPLEMEGFTAELPLDVAETDGEFIVKASLPGFNPEDIDISLDNKTLTIKGEYKAEEKKDELHYHLHERRYGSFARSIALPTDVKFDAVEAKYDAGVLTLKLPKTDEVKPKRITIKSTEKPQMIEGRAKEIASKN
jgi:HSP20 family protein